MGAPDELGSRGLTDPASSSMSMALLCKYARGTALSAVVAAARDLERNAGGVLVVLLGDVVWMGTATTPAAEATTWTGLGVPFILQFPDTVMIIMWAGACRTA
jgi:hypothetical protein